MNQHSLVSTEVSTQFEPKKIARTKWMKFTRFYWLCCWKLIKTGKFHRFYVCNIDIMCNEEKKY